MANDEQVTLLKQGVAAWNAWRADNHDVRLDLIEANLGRADLKGANLSAANLSGADLKGANLHLANFRGANLRGANLTAANLRGAHLRGAHLRGATLCGAKLIEANLTLAHLTLADLTGADLKEANLRGANLSEANVSKVNLSGANLGGADLHGANLLKANLRGANLGLVNLWRANLDRANLTSANLIEAGLEAAILVNTDFTDADLTGCRIYGVSAWNLKLERAKQQDLIITPRNEPEITVDNIEVAQFIYLMLHNERIRDVIDTIGKKGVLLLGRFTEGRMMVLERLRNKLRELRFVPMVFNFDKPETKDFTETVRLLCGLSKFVIVDITNPRSAPLELQATVPDYMVPFAPILQKGDEEIPSRCW